MAKPSRKKIHLWAFLYFALLLITISSIVPVAGFDYVSACREQPVI